MNDNINMNKNVESFISDLKHKKRNIKEHLIFKKCCFVIPLILIIIYLIPSISIIITKIEESVKMLDENNVIFTIIISLIASFLVWGFVEYRTLIYDIKEKVINERDEMRTMIINIDDVYKNDSEKYNNFLSAFQKILLKMEYYSVTHEAENLFRVVIENNNTNEIKKQCLEIFKNNEWYDMQKWIDDIKDNAKKYNKYKYDNFTYYKFNNDKIVNYDEV